MVDKCPVESIKSAVENGQTVCWSSRAYEVVKDELGQWFIKCLSNGHLIGLTSLDGELNGKPEDFFTVA